MRLSKLFCSSRIYKSLNFSNASMRALSGATGPSGQKSDIACAPEKKNDEKDAARGGGPKKGVVLGVYMTDKDLELTPAAEEINQRSGGKLTRYMNELSCELQLGKAFIVTDVEPELGDVALTSFGPKNAGYNKLEELDEAKENVRWGIGAGVSLLRHRGCATVAVDPATSPDAAAEAAELAAWSFQEFKSKRKLPLSVSMLGEQKSESGEQGVQLWERGAIMADAQNWARYMSDMPANKMTPIDLAQEALDVLCPLGVQVLAHEREWAESLGMEAFLAVARGSCEPPVLLECIYDGGPGDQAPVLLAAKGVTFDSGGLCLKNPDHMRENRGSMAGAAVVLGAMKAIARLKVPLNVRAVIPLCENMVSGQCMRVGDVVRVLNGTTVQIEDTDMEGRLMLADALVYGQSQHRPALVVDVATLTRKYQLLAHKYQLLAHGVLLATGGGAFGCFSNNEAAWLALRSSGAHTGDRGWRFPLWDYYLNQITNDPSVDLRNKGSGRATPCLGAAFLKNFVCSDWLHLDITGVGKLMHSAAPPYLEQRRMSGRPTRTLAHFLSNLPDTDKQIDNSQQKQRTTH